MKSIKKSGIKSWPKEDRPREKLFREGEHKLTDAELLAILLRTGRKGESALSLARKIMKKFKTFRNIANLDLSQWKEFKGLGIAKVAQIKAAIEIGRRFGEEKIREIKPQVKSAHDVYQILHPRMRDLRKEVFKVILLDSRNRILGVLEIEEGTVNKASPMLREIFTKAIQNFAVSIICVHNHPSGNPEPSKEDIIFTERLKKAGDVLDVEVLDHIIIGEDSYYSFADENLI
jgi:DNA repair protein RadC